MGLTEYNKKRTFSNTPEPKANKNTSKGSLRFVVQRHHASRLHYDFRLELDGVLKSWAVPKGPSLNPKDKRLAMMVEDHPYSYRTFEGTIPEGNYGAGVVTIFDEGTYEAIDGTSGETALKKGLNSGDLKFRLHGRILNGEFALIKLKNSEDNAWLLIKHKDEFSTDKNFDSEELVSDKIKKEGLARKTKKQSNSAAIATEKIIEKTPVIKDKPSKEISYKPMLAKLSADVFDDERWIYEKKLDGYRAIAYAGSEVKLISRNGIDFSHKYRNIINALKQIKTDAVLDGELVAEDDSGKSDFQNLQNYATKSKQVTLKYYAFDLLALNGHDLRQLELIKRKQLLKVLVEQLANPLIIYSEHIEKTGIKLFAEAEENGWEGIIAKDGSSTYESNKRSDRWLKFKLQNSQEAIIIGYSKPAGSRKYFGSLVLAMYEQKELVYIGNCGTGFNETTLKEVYSKMNALASDTKPVRQKVPNERTITWIIPELVCEVTFSEWTGDKHLRHPVFKGLRYDKGNNEVQQEIPETSRAPSKTTRMKTTKEKGANSNTQESLNDKEEVYGKKTLKLTNLNKLYWKKEGITKGQLIEYYRSVSNYILPFLKDRPLSLNRHPNGIDAPNFFQKDLDTDQIPDWIQYQPMYSESNDKDIDYLICNDLPTLLWMANLGCIEINPWLSTYKKAENPVFAVMDLDPNDVDDFTEVVRVALTAKELLTQMGIKPWIKTSGSRGLHIFIHVGQQYDYDIIKDFIHYLGQMIMKHHPETTSLERSPSKRKNKIYLDFLQNRRGQTIAAPYSARPKPGATVSTPLDWDEVNEQLNIKVFTIFNTLKRIQDSGDLWKDITKEKTDLKSALSSMK
ncbi:DNA ligase D [Paradesertivirga mongoliensis]|uniref:DNA ligase (ATP) n=1 Tax=Paradesertivirga mongoliensis TaxID=2100740 RepID=A0ABW4ZQ18_9SPHI|nr:DNA ligase D [Pedobacter mongoliensis]